MNLQRFRRLTGMRGIRFLTGMRGICFAVVLVALAACGTASAATTPAKWYRADVTVLTDSRHGPQLCADVAVHAAPVRRTRHHRLRLECG